jgi:uncharacterized membrane protein
MHMGIGRRIARLFRHRWQDDSRRAIPRELVERLTQRVAASEKHHTGEIRICVEAGLPTSYVMRDATARERAVAMFGKLRTWDTQHNNGVLVYLLLAERAIEIVADRGLTSRVPEAQWRLIVDGMRGAFREGRYEDGLNQAVDQVTALLEQHFPLAPGEQRVNELPDEPALG